MAQTRSTKAATSPNPTSDSEPQAPPPTFNGNLNQFAYTSSQTPPPASPTKPNPPLSRRIPKRGLPTTSNAPPRPSLTKRRKSSKYADPSVYAHLAPLTDILEPNLIGVFVGTNPGVQTATAGHAYAHPSNHFWKLVHSSGITERRLKPEEDGTLPAKYCMGNTNIVSRPSKDAGELTKEEIAAGTKDLEEKFRRFRPEAVCIVGKGIWEGVWRWRYGRGFQKGEFRYGWQDEGENMGVCGEGEEGGVWGGARVFVTTTTSGLAASLKPAEKAEIWRPFGEWVQKRRAERGFKPTSVVKGEE